MQALPGNVEAIEAWNTVLFEKFTRFRALMTGGAAVHGNVAIERHAPAPGARVLDVGCGFGDTTLQLAAKVGPSGSVVGVDAANNFLEVARQEAAGHANVRYETADIEAGVPGGPYDLAFSRMGTMFFNSPVFALRHVRKALVPGGKLCIVVWRKKDANECFAAAERVLHGIFGDPPKNDQVTCGPGPFSMASPDLVSDQLTVAGYRDVSFARNDGLIRIGRDLPEATAFALSLGPAGEVFRLAGAAAIARRAEVEAAVCDVLSPYLTPDGVLAPSSTWIVTATS